MSASRQHPDPSKRPNRLANASSPYLLQHRFNPVDWWQWGPEAFDEARRRDVPIFLSVGYSTCYWCHVMERESLENHAIASSMNERFVCIKLDREERPDVDEVYMAAVQAFTGRGGWPMSVFLEPHSLKPFWAGTYFPATPKFTNVPTFPHVLDSISAAWNAQRGEVLAQAESLAEAVRERVADRPPPVRIGDHTIQRGMQHLLRMHDRVHGGFGPAPKFPQPVFLELLLGVRNAAANKDTRDAIDLTLRTTLDAMALGGICDHLGGGFHRYSVDATWTVPHFEKMLYDNAQLLSVYSRASDALGDAFYAEVASRIVSYILREMRSPTGAFFSAQDAEVDTREGASYVWTAQQIESTLGPDDASFANRVFSLDAGPNFQDPHHPHDAPCNVLRLGSRPAELARAFHVTESAFAARFERVRAAMLVVRDRRPQPSTDTKVLVSWNALMIMGLVDAARYAGDPRALGAAKDAARAILRHMRAADGSLLRCLAVQPGADAPAAHTPGMLEDYSLLIRALAALHACETSPEWLNAAEYLAARAAQLFTTTDSAFADVSHDTRDLFVRPRICTDGAMSSGIASMLRALLDLHALTGSPDYLRRAASALAAISGSIEASPLSAAGSLLALLEVLGRDRSVLENELDKAGARAPSETVEQEGSPVEVLAEGDHVELAPGEAASMYLRVSISPGFHVIGASPGESLSNEGLVPFRVHVLSGSGVRVFADYPEGTPMSGADDSLRVYEGEFDLPLVIERTGTWTGTPLIGITFQPCTRDACLAARTIELDVAIDRRDAPAADSEHSQ